jgi:hypothetical protein
VTPIDVREQTRLSPARILNLCLKGIRHRLFRSLLTTTVIILAVAFFMVLLADSVIARAVGQGVQSEIRQARRPAVVVDLWFGHPSPTVLAGRIAASDAPLSAYAGLAGWEPARLGQLAAACARERTILAWFEELDAGTRSILVGVERPDEGLARLAQEDGWRSFLSESATLRALHLPLPREEIRAAALAQEATIQGCEALAKDWTRGVERIAQALRSHGAGDDQRAWLAWLASADQKGLEAFAAILAQNGLATLFPTGELQRLQEALRLEAHRDAIVERLKSDAGRAAWLKAFASQPGIDEKLLLVADRRADAVFGDAMPRAEREAVQAAVIAERDLAAKERRLAGKLSDDGSLVSVRQAFLIGISLLVCMVGIANAMLMAITERFREIATMKCLGATDGFILTQFLMEAGIQGAAGGALGMLIGVLFSLLKAGWLFDLHLLWYFPALGLVIAGAACVVIGLLLATIASIYPSWVASRMAPMEAMRVE